MSAKLLFGIHCHQPVDNFHWVVKKAVERAYLPFVKRVSECERFKFAVHFSGWLLEFIEKNYGELFDLLRLLVKSGQVEFFTGGFYEPVLVSIPSKWRRYQIERLTGYIEDRFDTSPRGLWLTERVWDDSVVVDLVKCNVEYVVVDDYHFICAGFERKDLDGFFLTESEGYPLKIFPIDMKLRYLVPFKPAKDAAEYLRAQTGVKTLFDDGEKFGIWPGTYDWVYKEGWLDSFLTLVEEGQIETQLFSECVRNGTCKGLVYLPTASYYEMGEWTVPAERFVELQKLKEFLKRQGLDEYVEKFVRGGIWKNFFVKYPESNYMHKRMLDLTSYSCRKKAFLEELSKAQCNDAFWHGIFGGLYLPNLRDNFWRFFDLCQ